MLAHYNIRAYCHRACTPTSMPDAGHLRIQQNGHCGNYANHSLAGNDGALGEDTISTTLFEAFGSEIAATQTRATFARVISRPATMIQLNTYTQQR
eukprot:scaffold1973_cov399-Prasinococcus_capsulatus_cf.AAC.28